MFGGQTNVISLYADPELEETWWKYRLRDAALVISCMNTRFQSNLLLCKFMANTRVPVVCVCDTKDEAAALYEAGCTYVQQPVEQNSPCDPLCVLVSCPPRPNSLFVIYLVRTTVCKRVGLIIALLPHTGVAPRLCAQVLTSANDLKEMLHEELVATKNMFNRALDHQDALDEEESDVLRNQVSRFM